MIKNNLIVIPFNLPWEWTTDYTNQTALILSKQNTVFCFMWFEDYSLKEYLLKGKLPHYFKKVSENLYLYYPIQIIPFKRFRTVYTLNKKINMYIFKLRLNILNRMNQYQSRLLWIFDPILQPTLKYFNSDWKIIYDCVDLFTGIKTNDRKNVVVLEKKLIQKADLTTANSIVLKKHLQIYKKDIKLVPQGFRIDSFKKMKTRTPVIKDPGRPLIGYLGAVNYRLDYQLFYRLALAHPEWDFALWGPLLETELLNGRKLEFYKKLNHLPNVKRGQAAKDQVPGIIRQFDIAIIPYDTRQEFNKYCYPMKIFEYFYSGKPVISTDITELKRFPRFIRISNNTGDWERYIEELLKKKWPKKYIDEQIKLAISNSWFNKINTISNYLETLNINK